VEQLALCITSHQQPEEYQTLNSCYVASNNRMIKQRIWKGSVMIQLRGYLIICLHELMKTKHLTQYMRLDVAFCLLPTYAASLFRLVSSMVRTAHSSKRLVPNYQTTLCHIPEGRGTSFHC
jgi:hypothetical protein